MDRQSVLKEVDLAQKEGRPPNLAGADLAGADLSKADLAEAYLAGANLVRANLAGADLDEANLSKADLSKADLAEAYLSKADLAGADLSKANLAGAYLAGADLTGAYLTEADLTEANLSKAYLARANLARANLDRANLSGATGITDPSSVIKEYFERDELGVIVYKAFGTTYYTPPLNWLIEPGSFISEVCNTNRADGCGCGVNFGTLEWIRNKFQGRQITIWRCRIHNEDAFGVTVPFKFDGKARCSRLELLEVVEEVEACSK